MPKVTGMGCTATALTGAFAAVCEDSLKAAATAMAIMAVAGETAKARALGPGTFQMYFLDALYNLSDIDIAKHLKI
jgi:hydroxyethylthiazole kinase